MSFLYSEFQEHWNASVFFWMWLLADWLTFRSCVGEGGGQGGAGGSERSVEPVMERRDVPGRRPSDKSMASGGGDRISLRHSSTRSPGQGPSFTSSALVKDSMIFTVRRCSRTHDPGAWAVRNLKYWLWGDPLPGCPSFQGSFQSAPSRWDSPTAVLLTPLSITQKCLIQVSKCAHYT